MVSSMYANPISKYSAKNSCAARWNARRKEMVMTKREIGTVYKSAADVAMHGWSRHTEIGKDDADAYVSVVQLGSIEPKN